MSAQTLYSGPGKVRHSHALGNFVFHAEGENGQVKLAVLEKRTARSSATFGYQRSTLDDQLMELTFTPFESWALLPVLFPTYLGVTSGTSGANAGKLVVGTRPHDFAANLVNGHALSTVWTPDQRLYSLYRTAITQHPNMKLGVGQPLFEGAKITGLWDAAAPTYPGGTAANFLQYQTGIADPDTTGFTPDFVNGHWLATWGSDTNFANMEVEDFWTLSVSAKYSPLTVQKLTRHMKLDSVEFMIKGRVAGPTHDELLGYVLAHTLGGTITGTNAGTVVLSGPSNKTITLNDAELFLDNQGFEFGGTKLGTGEVAFVTKLDFSAGAPTPALIFSA